MGRTNKFYNEDHTTDYEQNKGARQQERYLVYNAKGIIIKKKHALELLKDLKIKVYPERDKQIHFVDVFKALMKRILINSKMDYKLSPNLNRKIKTQWHKIHKNVVQGSKKTDTTAYQEQAGVIITKWAKKILEQKKNSFKKTTAKAKNKPGVGGKVTEESKKGEKSETYDAITRKM